MQELERAFAVDLVESVEGFDVGAVAEIECVRDVGDFDAFVANHSSEAEPFQRPHSLQVYLASFTLGLEHPLPRCSTGTVRRARTIRDRRWRLMRRRRR